MNIGWRIIVRWSYSIDYNLVNLEWYLLSIITNIKKLQQTKYQFKSTAEGFRSCLFDDWILLRITRSSDAVFFLQTTDKKHTLHVLFVKVITVVQLFFSLHHSILLEQDSLHESMLEFDLNIALDSIVDVEFHRKIWWNNHHD